MRRFAFIVLLLLPLARSSSQGTSAPTSVAALESPLPLSNSSSVITTSGDTVWLGTSEGLSFTTNAGSSWNYLANTSTFDDKAVAAIAVRNSIVWTSVAGDETQDGQSISVGGGLHWSSDGGTNWTYVPQPVDAGTVDTLTYGINKIAALAVTVPQQNVTYDIDLSSTAVWIASFAGMLRRSTDNGASWERVILPPDGLDSIAPTDTLDFDLAPTSGSLGLRGNLNHRVFSVHVSDDTTIWVGTANGINKSTDGGVSWRKFNYQNQLESISGNFVVAINEQRYSSERIIWAATVNATDPNETMGVSYTTNGGTTWTTTLLGERAHNIAFKDSITYVATNRGLFRSDDRGSTWILNGLISDPSTGQRFTTHALFAVGVIGDTVWVAGADGVAYTLDTPSEPFGRSWEIFRTYVPVASSGESYAFPNPFSPGDEIVRIHYSVSPKPSASVTIRIFDFAMLPARTLIQNAVRTGSIEHDEIWDGRDDYDRIVSNGVYFYRIEIEGEEARWGKILVLQ